MIEKQWQIQKDGVFHPATLLTQHETDGHLCQVFSCIITPGQEPVYFAFHNMQCLTHDSTYLRTITVWNLPQVEKHSEHESTDGEWDIIFNGTRIPARLINEFTVDGHQYLVLAFVRDYRESYPDYPSVYDKRKPSPVFVFMGESRDCITHDPETVQAQKCPTKDVDKGWYIYDTGLSPCGHPGPAMVHGDFNFGGKRIQLATYKGRLGGRVGPFMFYDGVCLQNTHWKLARP